MLLWLSLLLCGCVLLALGAAAYYLPLSPGCNVQARAEPSGSWTLACGIALGPVALTAIAVAGVPPFVTCHVFGKQLLRLPVSRWLRRQPKQPSTALGDAEPKPEQEGEATTPAVNFSQFERSVARFFRALDPVDTVLTWWEKERIFEVRKLQIDVEYSFRDVALTGQILAGLYMLSGVLPDRYVINQQPIWESEDRVLFTADGRFRIWPGRLLVDLVSFVLKQRSRVRREAVPASE